MLHYIKLGRVRGLSIETSGALGAKPIFRKKAFQNEVIIDIPYVQLIYTSGQWQSPKVSLKRKYGSNNNGKSENTKTGNGVERVHAHRS